MNSRIYDEGDRVVSLTARLGPRKNSEQLGTMINRPFSREKEPPATLNWRRGLIRLWILISSAWIMAWLIYFAITYIGDGLTNPELLAIPIVLLGPPLALLLFGIATRWAFRGFQA